MVAVTYVEPLDGVRSGHPDVPNSVLVDQNTRKWWLTQSQMAMRWSLVAGALLMVLLLIFLGYLHAQRRIKCGLKPMLYHRWLVPQWQMQLYRHQDMQEYHQTGDERWMPNPPPPYNPNAIMPPSYQPPPRFSKVVTSEDEALVREQMLRDLEAHRPPQETDQTPPPSPLPTRPVEAHVTV